MLKINYKFVCPVCKKHTHLILQETGVVRYKETCTVLHLRMYEENPELYYAQARANVDATREDDDNCGSVIYICGSCGYEIPSGSMHALEQHGHLVIADKHTCKLPMP